MADSTPIQQHAEDLLNVVSEALENEVTDAAGRTYNRLKLVDHDMRGRLLTALDQATEALGAPESEDLDPERFSQLTADSVEEIKHALAETEVPRAGFFKRVAKRIGIVLGRKTSHKALIDKAEEARRALGFLDPETVAALVRIAEDSGKELVKVSKKQSELTHSYTVVRNSESREWNIFMHVRDKATQKSVVVGTGTNKVAKELRHVHTHSGRLSTGRAVRAVEKGSGDSEAKLEVIKRLTDVPHVIQMRRQTWSSNGKTRTAWFMRYCNGGEFGTEGVGAVRHQNGFHIFLPYSQIEPHEKAQRWIYMLQVLKGVAGMHDRGVYHTDLKPSNVFIHDRQALVADVEGGVPCDSKGKVLDSVTAPVVASQLWASQDHYTLAKLRGVARKVPEEKLLRWDLFSLGRMIEETLHPFGWPAEGPLHIGQTTRAYASGSPIEKVINRCCSNRKSERATSVHDVLRDLRVIADTELRKLGLLEEFAEELEEIGIEVADSDQAENVDQALGPEGELASGQNRTFEEGERVSR